MKAVKSKKADGIDCGNGSLCPFSNYLYGVSKTFSTIDAYLSYAQTLPQYSASVFGKPTVISTVNTTITYRVLLYYSNGVMHGSFVFYRTPNLYYSSTSTPPAVVEVSTDEIAQKISDRVSSTNDALSQQLIQDAYSYDNNFGINDAENSLSTAQGNKLTDALQQAAKAESGTYTSADGITTASVQPATNASTSTGEATTTNPDGTTSATSIEQTIEWPAVCDYAAFLCEWWQWTQEKYDEFMKEPEDEDTQLDIDDLQQTDINTTINFGGQCPAPITLIDSQVMGIAWHWEYDFTDFCTILTSYVRPILIALGAFIAVLILGGVKINE